MLENNTFNETIADFNQFLVISGGINKHSRTNYLSWLKFLSKDYTINNELTNDKIEFIIQEEKTKLNIRNIYTSEKDLVNFKSALRKYKQFICSDFHKKKEETILAQIREISKEKSIPLTERSAIINSRIGQGLFRDNLIKYWNGCSLSGYNFCTLLIASHIKPWSVSDNSERLDVYNGLLLLPNYDKLFDMGFISFNTKGKIIISDFLPKSDRQLLGINNDMKLSHIDDKHKPFLKYHNQNCLIQ